MGLLERSVIYGCGLRVLVNQRIKSHTPSIIKIAGRYSSTAILVYPLYVCAELIRQEKMGRERKRDYGGWRVLELARFFADGMLSHTSRVMSI